MFEILIGYAIIIKGDFMKIILCLDDNNGMLFNNRRQSRDRVLVEDIINNLQGEKLNIFEFSKALFEDFSDKICIAEKLEKGKLYFVENLDLEPFSKDITEIIVYKWNRIYPADFYCKIDFGFRFFVAEETELSGNSHEKITKIIWRVK